MRTHKCAVPENSPHFCEQSRLAHLVYDYYYYYFFVVIIIIIIFNYYY